MKKYLFLILFLVLIVNVNAQSPGNFSSQIQTSNPMTGQAVRGGTQVYLEDGDSLVLTIVSQNKQTIVETIRPAPGKVAYLAISINGRTDDAINLPNPIHITP